MDRHVFLVITLGPLKNSPVLSTPIDFSCFSTGIEHIPDDIPLDTTRILCWDNSISKVLETDFDGLSDLQTIDLGRNEVSEFPNLSKLNKLILLMLHGNHLTKESFQNFNIPASLIKLDLRQNQLTELPVLCQYKESLIIDLSQNPIVCDARIAWLLSPGFAVTGVCSSPQHLSGSEIGSLSYADLEITAGK